MIVDHRAQEVAVVRLAFVAVQRVLRIGVFVERLPLDVLGRHILEAEDPALRSRLQRAPLLVAEDADEVVDVARVIIPACIELEGTRVVDVRPAVVETKCRSAVLVILRLLVAVGPPFTDRVARRIRARIVPDQEDVFHGIPHRTEDKSEVARRIRQL